MTRGTFRASCRKATTGWSLVQMIGQNTIASTPSALKRRASATASGVVCRSPELTRL